MPLRCMLGSNVRHMLLCRCCYRRGKSFRVQRHYPKVASSPLGPVAPFWALGSRWYPRNRSSKGSHEKYSACPKRRKEVPTLHTLTINTNDVLLPPPGNSLFFGASTEKIKLNKNNFPSEVFTPGVCRDGQKEARHVAEGCWSPGRN